MKDSWHGTRRFVSYAFLVLIPVAALGGVLTHTIIREADRTALATAVLQAQSINESAVESQLDGHLVGEGLRQRERSAVRLTTGPLLTSGTVLRLRLRDVVGRIMFDAAKPDLPPGRELVDDEVEDAARGVVVALRTRLGADQADGAHINGARAVEVYLAVRVHRAGVSRTVGVLELYVPYDPIAVARDASLRRTWLVLVAGLGLVWLVLAGIVWSVTRRIHRQNETNRYLALHDVLTGLPNRALFADRITHALASAARTGLPVSVAIVDLDRFKEVNDTLGHANGDALLRYVAASLQRELRPGDTVARLGGDEFGIILPEVGGEQVREVLRRVASAVGEDVELDGLPVAVEASIGWAEWPVHAQETATLLRCADTALYVAKDAKTDVVRYESAFSRVNPGRLGLVAELRRALGAGELELHYQPKVEIGSQRPVGFEALVRWHHPTRGLVKPDEFIHIAESTGLIGPLTRRVFDHAVGQLAAWGIQATPLSMAVNISARNLRDPQFSAWILERLFFHRIHPSRVVLEITETAFTTDQTRAAIQIAELQAAGVRVSLDDFGQGYTSLSQLAHLRVRELKIDRGFITALHTSPKDHAIVASVIELGHQLGLNVVAEGVETYDVLKTLEALGCDHAQGFLFARPLPADDVPAYLHGTSAQSVTAARNQHRNPIRTP